VAVAFLDQIPEFEAVDVRLRIVEEVWHQKVENILIYININKSRIYHELMPWFLLC
jgi:hypothetical protein